LHQNEDEEIGHRLGGILIFFFLSLILDTSGPQLAPPLFFPFLSPAAHREIE